MDKEKDKEEFEEHISDLWKEYEKNPEVVNNKLSKFIISLGEKENNNLKANPLGDVDKEKLVIIFIIIFMALFGLINIKTCPLYYFGLVFFIAGFFVSRVDIVGLIFLFSHGLTGLCLMEGAVLSEVVSSPYMSDNPIKIYFFIGIIITILLVAFLLTIVSCLSKNVSLNKKTIPVLLTIYAVGFLLTELLPHFVKYLI